MSDFLACKCGTCCSCSPAYVDRRSEGVVSELQRILPAKCLGVLAEHIDASTCGWAMQCSSNASYEIFCFRPNSWAAFVEVQGKERPETRQLISCACWQDRLGHAMRVRMQHQIVLLAININMNGQLHGVYFWQHLYVSSIGQ